MKIKKRTKKEKELIGKLERKNEIMELLNDCFEPKSLDEMDRETILRWACLGGQKEKLVYLFEKIKLERLNDN